MALYALLAAGDDGAEIVGVLVLVVLSIIGAVVQKAKHKADTKRAEEEYLRRRQEREATMRGGPGRIRRPTVASRPAAPVPPPPQPAYAAVTRQHGMPQAGDAVALQRQRQREQELHLQQQTMAEQAAVVAAAEATPEPTLVPAPPMRPMPVRGHPLIQTRDDLRRAIILHEVFSPPKALRMPEGLWEL